MERAFSPTRHSRRASAWTSARWSAPAQAYAGRRVLTWWKGRVLELGFGEGEDIVMDPRYRTIARVPGANGLKADLHDFRIAPRGVAYITAYNPIHCDLAAAGGARRATIVDTAVQEIDMKTGLRSEERRVGKEC